MKMNKNTVIFLKYHTVEEGKNMDREKLNMKIVDAVFKTTLTEKIVLWAIIVIGLAYPIIRLIAGR